jgi:hypothetical protein
MPLPLTNVDSTKLHLSDAQKSLAPYGVNIEKLYYIAFIA